MPRPRKGQLGPFQLEVLQAIAAADGPVTSRGLAADLGEGKTLRRRVDRALEAMVAKGLLARGVTEREGQGWAKAKPGETPTYREGDPVPGLMPDDVFAVDVVPVRRVFLANSLELTPAGRAALEAAAELEAEHQAEHHH